MSFSNRSTPTTERLLSWLSQLSTNASAFRWTRGLVDEDHIHSLASRNLQGIPERHNLIRLLHIVSSNGMMPEPNPFVTTQSPQPLQPQQQFRISEKVNIAITVASPAQTGRVEGRYDGSEERSVLV